MLCLPPISTLFPYTTLFRSSIQRSIYYSRRPTAPDSWSAALWEGSMKASACKSRSEEHTSELQSLRHLVCRLLLEKKKKKQKQINNNTQSKKKKQQQ